MVSVGELIFVSVRPLVKLILPTLAGFCLARLGQFPEQSTKSVVRGHGLEPIAERGTGVLDPQRHPTGLAVLQDLSRHQRRERVIHRRHRALGADLYVSVLMAHRASSTLTAQT